MTLLSGAPEWAKESHPAVQFFYVFSKMEHALKSCSFLKSEIDGHKAEVCWDSFSKRLDKDFIQTIKDKRVDWELFSDPPRRQLVMSGRLDFEEKGPDIANNHELFAAIRRVRNNLFHGGKYQKCDLLDPARNEKLLEECTFVLGEALKENDEVSRVFLE